MARCEAAGPEEPEVYSLEYIEEFFWPSKTQMVTDRSPSRTVMSDRPLDQDHFP